MDRRQADEIAFALGGAPVRSPKDPDGGGEWLVMIERSDGRLVVITDTSVDEYCDHAAYEAEHCYATIDLH